MTLALLVLVLVLVGYRLAPVPASLRAHPSWPPPIPDNCYRLIRPDGTSVLVDITTLGPDHRDELEHALDTVRRIAETQGRPEPHG